MPVSLSIWLPPVLVESLEVSKKFEKNFAGLVNANVFIAVNGNALDLLHAVSAGA